MPSQGLLGLFAGASLIAFFSLRRAVLGWRSRRWPTVTGTVDRSEVEYCTVGDLGIAGTPESAYQAVIAYVYTVSGAHFRGTQIGFTSLPVRPTRAEAHNDIRRYRLGSAVVVYYDPRRPQRSVLEPGAEPSSVVFGLLSGVAAIGLLCWGVLKLNLGAP